MTRLERGETAKLLRSLRRGDRRALSRAITMVENDEPGADALMASLKGGPGRAFILGVTGPPGTGKSTLVDRLVQKYRGADLKVGVIAVDPSSPITGGALLGDRVRMSDLALDGGAYIRSMASRGWAGGLSRATSRAMRLLDEAGYDLVIVETVGIGQADIDVVGVAHAVLVVLMPGLGDDVQVSKAGLMEVADAYVVNKSDLDGADSMVVDILAMVKATEGRSPPVLKVSALKAEGLDRLAAVVDSFRSRLSSGDEEMKLRSTKGMIVELAKAVALQRLLLGSETRLARLAAAVLKGELSVEEAARKLAG
jgi:GTPase